MPKLARLYLDTARLGPMSPGAQLAARDFARLAGEGLSTLYFQKLLRGFLTPTQELFTWPGLGHWPGVEGLKSRLRQLLALPSSAPLLLASRTTSLLRWAARQLCQRCRRIFIPDTAWPPYARILEEELSHHGGGQVIPFSLRAMVQNNHVSADEVTARLTQTFLSQGCDGLFLAAVSHDGVRISTSSLLSTLRRKSNLRLAVIDGAQELAHVPVNLTATGCDIWTAGAHKWLGGHQPLGIACLPNPDSATHLFQAAVADYQTPLGDDPLLRFLLQWEGRFVQEVPETVNLAPLFTTWGALQDILVDQRSQARRFQIRQQNATVISRLLAQTGWQARPACPSLATGILVLRADDSAIRQLPAQALEARFENAGVSLTALGGGELRVSLPATLLDNQQQSHLIQAFIAARNGGFSADPDRAKQNSCAQELAS